VQRYENKVAIITGGGGAIGGAIARRLSSEGAAVAVLDQLGDQAERMASELETGGGKAIALTADITDKPAVEAGVVATLEAYGRIDLLVNNAGYTKSGSLADLDPDEFNKELNINLTGSYICAAAVLPTMIEAGRGAIVNIGSVNGRVAVGNPAYSAAKAGLYSLTQSLATEYGPKGVRTNMVSPGTIETDIYTWRVRREKNPEIFDVLARWYPVGRVGQPEDVAPAVAFLGADEAGFVNGANLMVDGGLTCGLAPMIEEMILE